MKLGRWYAVLLIASYSGIIGFVTMGFINFPSFWREKSALMAIIPKRDAEKERGAKLEALLKELPARIQQSMQVREKAKEVLKKETFDIKTEARIPQFVDELQNLLSLPDLNMQNLAYGTRITEEGFVTLPFELKLESSYSSLRRMLYLLESGYRGLRIDKFEIHTLQAPGGRIGVRLLCSARFKSGGAG